MSFNSKKLRFEKFYFFFEMNLHIESSTKSHLDRGEFDHLVVYSLACTFENDVVSVRKYEGFGSINEVIDEGGLECLNDGKVRRLGECQGCSTGRAPWLDRA